MIVDPWWRRLGPALAGVLVLALLAGCTPAAQPPSQPGIASVAASLARSLATADRDAFLGSFGSSDHARAIGRLWFDNLAQFEEVRFTPASATSFTVTTGVCGDSMVAQAHVTIAPSNEDPLRIGSHVPGEHDPLWTVEAVTVAKGSAGSVILGDGFAGEPTQWTRRLDRAVAAVVKADLGPLSSGWGRCLLVEVPAQATSFQRISGEPPAIAAVTLGAGVSTRIVVNPSAASALDEVALDALVLHEAMHAASDTPSRPGAPRWLIEGLAEWVVNRADPSSRAESRRLVRQFLDSGPAPTALPTDRQVVDGGPDPLTGYALAAVVVDAMVAELGHRAAMEAAATMLGQPSVSWTPSEQAITAWYLAELDRR